MTAQRRLRALHTGAAVALGLMVAACATNQSGSDSDSGQVLSTTETAPADLQLTCSNAAVSRFGLPPDKVLPVSSRKLSDGSYEVELTSGSSSFVCIVDDSANVISLNPV